MTVAIPVESNSHQWKHTSQQMMIVNLSNELEYHHSHAIVPIHDLNPVILMSLGVILHFYL